MYEYSANTVVEHALIGTKSDVHDNLPEGDTYRLLALRISISHICHSVNDD